MAVVSKITIASNALLLLGGNTISSFEEESTEAKIAANLYETAYESILTTHRWRFASKKAKLARLSETPENEYNYAFQIPSDCLYVAELSTSNYEIFEDKIFANVTDIDIDYTYSVSEDKLPAYFTKMFEFYLAAQFAVPLTGSMDKGRYYSQMYINEMRRAKFTDSTQRPNDTFEDAPYLVARY